MGKLRLRPGTHFLPDQISSCLMSVSPTTWVTHGWPGRRHECIQLKIQVAPADLVCHSVGPLSSRGRGGRRRGSPSLLSLGDPIPHEELEGSYSLSEAICVKGAASIQASSPLPRLPKTVPVLTPKVPCTRGSQTRRVGYPTSNLPAFKPPQESTAWAPVSRAPQLPMSPGNPPGLPPQEAASISRPCSSRGLERAERASCTILSGSSVAITRHGQVSGSPPQRPGQSAGLLPPRGQAQGLRCNGLALAFRGDWPGRPTKLRQPCARPLPPCWLCARSTRGQCL